MRRSIFRIISFIAAAVVAVPPLAAGATGHTRTLTLPATDDVTVYRYGVPPTSIPSAGSPRFPLLYVAGDAFRTERRIALRFSNLSEFPHDFDLIERAHLQLYGAGGFGENHAKVCVMPSEDLWEGEGAPIDARGLGVHSSAPRVCQTVVATGVGQYFSFEVTETVRRLVAGHQLGVGIRPEIFSVSATPVDPSDPNDRFILPFHSKDATDPAAWEESGNPVQPGNPPRLKIVYRQPPVRAVAPTPTVYTVASPTPSPSPEKPTKKTTKGAFTERRPSPAAPWWMSDFLARLLGYRD